MSPFTVLPRANVHLYGMIVLSTIHRLAGAYPDADAYAEVAETQVVPGGEAGNAALVLASWGHRVKVAGPFLGRQTRDGIVSFLSTRGIDCTGLHFDDSFDGVRDLVLVAGKTRTVFGWFGAYFAGPCRWAEPSRPDIARADIVGIDPFFGEASLATGRICEELRRPYVTIDCAPESPLHRGAAATVVSGEYLREHFPAADRVELLRTYAEAGPGLVIFTSGSAEILFARRGGRIGRLQAFAVTPKCTLGAGDTFRAGVIHAVHAHFPDREVVRFAAATAACVCQRFPMALNPPSLADIAALAGPAST